MNMPTFKYLFLLVCLITFNHQLSAQLPPDFYDVKILDGFQLPLGITFDENGQGYIWEQNGQVFVLDQDGELLPTPLIDLSEEVSAWNDHGLNGFCLDNDFLTNGRFYMFYVMDLHHYWHFGTPEYHPDTTITNKATFARIVRYEADSSTGFTTIKPDSRKILVGEDISNGIPILFPFHGAGTILQSVDGTLLCSAGEGVGGTQIGIGHEPDDEFTPDAIEWGIITEDEDIGSYRSQYLGSNNGKVLRFDAETGNGVPSNPFFDTTNPRSPQSRTWLMGFRNPYRMMMRPNTGSHSASEGNPGTLVVCDVGNGSWEEINIATEGGQNFGWPIFEGIDLAWKYWIQDVPVNALAPNPITNCNKPFLNFRELLAFPKESGPYVPANPCDPTSPIPAELHPSYAQVPLIVWNNSSWNPPQRAATPGWRENGDVNPVFLDEPESTVEGEMFQGFSSLAGVFYEGDQFPEEYRGRYFGVDFSGWIRLFDIEADNTLKKVEPFHDLATNIIHLTQNLVDGSLYYTNVSGEIHKISYGGNPAPVAVIEADQFFGTSPLSVAFTAENSYDPNNNALTYEWDFGDGTNGTGLTPNHTFTSNSNDGQSFTVRLTVTDELGAQQSTERVVSLNNTPPNVEITSFKDGDQYPLGFTSLLRLTAKVTDNEHAEEELSYAWQTYLHHNTHFHPEPIDYSPSTYFLVSPIGCEQEIYYYRIELTVTDPLGLSTTVSQNIHPYCGEPFTDLLELTGTVNGQAVNLEWATTFEEDIVGMEIHRSHDFYHYEHIGDIAPEGQSSSLRNYNFTDETPMRGTNIYRIKVTTTDGAYSYSNLFNISYPKPLESNVFPNPTNYKVTFSIREASSEKIELQLFDGLGQYLRRSSFAAIIGDTWEKELIVDRLPLGVYSYRLIDGDIVYSGQLVVE